MTNNPQIDFWAAEVKRTSDESNRFFQKRNFPKAKESLLQSKTAIGRLRKEVENTDLFKDPNHKATLTQDLIKAETHLDELFALLEEIDH